MNQCPCEPLHKESINPKPHRICGLEAMLGKTESKSLNGLAKSGKTGFCLSPVFAIDVSEAAV